MRTQRCISLPRRSYDLLYALMDSRYRAAVTRTLDHRSSYKSRHQTIGDLIDARHLSSAVITRYLSNPPGGAHSTCTVNLTADQSEALDDIARRIAPLLQLTRPNASRTIAVLIASAFDQECSK